MTINALTRSYPCIAQDGVRRTQYPNGDYASGIVAITLAVSGQGQDVSAGGTITGVAPFAVFFDATSTTDSTSYDTFNALGYHHDFGYAAEADAGYWTYPDGEDNLAKCRYVGGPMAGHVYETPGTYTYSVKAQNPDGEVDYKYVTVVVTDPDTVYAGVTTTYVASSPGAGETLWPGTDVTLTSAANNTRIVFKPGTYVGTLKIPVTSGTAITGLWIGAYDPNSPPVFSSATGVQLCNNTTNLASIGTTTPGWPTNIIVSGIEGRVSDEGATQFLLIHNCDMTGKAVPGFGSIGDDYFGNQESGSGLTNQVWNNPRDVFIVGCTIDDPASTSTMFLYGSRVCWMGNYFGQSKEHGTRVKACYKGLYAFNYVTGYNDYPVHDGKNLITVRTQEISTIEADATTPATINKTGTWAATRVMKGTENQRGAVSTRFFVVDSNVLGATDHTADCPWGMAADMPNDFAVFYKSDIIFQRNKRYKSVTPTPLAALQPWNGQRITFRHNEDYTSGSSSPAMPSGTARLGTSTAQGNATMIADPTTYYGPYYINTGTETVTNGLTADRIIEAPIMLSPTKAP